MVDLAEFARILFLVLAVLVGIPLLWCLALDDDSLEEDPR